MSDLRFHEVGCESPRGKRRISVFCRRVLRRILRPIFERQVEILVALRSRIEVLELENGLLRTSLRDEIRGQNQRLQSHAAHIQAMIALGWDHVATTRRLASLEEHVESLLQESAVRIEPDARPSILFPGLQQASDDLAADPARSKVV